MSHTRPHLFLPPPHTHTLSGTDRPQQSIAYAHCLHTHTHLPPPPPPPPHHHLSPLMLWGRDRAIKYSPPVARANTTSRAHTAYRCLQRTTAPAGAWTLIPTAARPPHTDTPSFPKHFQRGRRSSHWSVKMSDDFLSSLKGLTALELMAKRDSIELEIKEFSDILESVSL